MDKMSVVRSINAYKKDCIGCVRFGAELMISIVSEDEPNVVHDFFLSREQAIAIQKQINERILTPGADHHDKKEKFCATTYNF